MEALTGEVWFDKDEVNSIGSTCAGSRCVRELGVFGLVIIGSSFLPLPDHEYETEL